MEETRIVGDLPRLRVEISHRQDPEGGAEHMLIQLTAQPSFQAFEALLNPFAAWSEALVAMMRLNPLVGMLLPPPEQE